MSPSIGGIGYGGYFGGAPERLENLWNVVQNPHEPQDNPKLFEMQAQRQFAGNQRVWMASLELMDSVASPIAKRLKLLRYAQGHPGHGGQTSFAKSLGISAQRWNNVEKGTPLGKDLALLLVQKCPGLSLGWLYSGIRTELSVGMDQRLNAAEQALNGNTARSKS